MAITPVGFIGVEGATYTANLYSLQPDSDVAAWSSVSLGAQPNRSTWFLFNVTDPLEGVYLFEAVSDGDGLVDSTGYVWMADDTNTHFVELTFAGAIQNRTYASPAVPTYTAVTSTIDVVTGDKLALPIDILDASGNTVPVDAGATVRAVFRHKRQTISPTVVCNVGAAGADWNVGHVVVEFSEAESAQIIIDQEQVCASLEVEVDDSGKKTRFVDNFVIREGLLV